ncbi:MAG: peptidyl-prolyl cis-trans isomerase [Thermoanaerobaculia bacterium]
MTRRILTALLLAVALGGCRTPADDPASAATTDRGAISFAAVERRLNAQGGATSADRAPELLEAFSRTTRELALRQLLIPEDSNERDRAVTGLGSVGPKIEHSTVVQLYRATQYGQIHLPTEADIAASFAAAGDRFVRPAQRFVWHLLLRAEPGESEASVIARARDLKGRIEAGASFSSIARLYSQSETRALGGRLGTISRGRLPPALEKIVFALGEGQVSEPVPIPGGVLLFQATDVIPEKRFVLADVRALLAREIFADRRRRAVRELAEKEPLPESSKILDQEALHRALALGDSEILLRVGEVSWSLGDLKKEVGAKQAEENSMATAIEIADRVYEDWVDSERTYRRAVREGFPVARAGELAERQREALDEEIYSRALEERLEKAALARKDEMERFYDDNKFLYQSPLRFKLRMLSIPIGASPSSQLTALGKAQSELESGRMKLETLAAQMGGRVQDAGWSTARDLESFEPKIRYFLADMTSPGFSVPFQFNQELCIIEVVERREPEVRPYSDVSAAVLRDFIERRRQDLFRSVQEEALRRGHYRYREEGVRAHLGLAPPTTSQ